MQINAFTTKKSGIARVLTNKVGVTEPIQTRLSDNIPIANQYIAIWDTGATNTSITNRVVQQLNLPPIGIANVHTTNGECTVNTYIIDLWLPNKSCIQNLIVTEGTIENADLLIGMDVMNIGDFAVSNFNGKTVFSFRMPSIVCTDYVAHANSFQPRKVDKVGRNDLCPCGSGKKYKQCCGK